MPEVTDHVYCSEHIHIPPTFPHVMKLYCKAAIRTQPYDLIKWSAAYFRALASGEEPPVKDRIEFPLAEIISGLTPGYLKVLIKQIGKDPKTEVPVSMLFNKWSNLCLPEEDLVKIVCLLRSTVTVNWLHFVAVGVGTLSKSLTQAMILVCELLTNEPEGAAAAIPLGVFSDLYSLLAYMDCGVTSEINDDIVLSNTKPLENEITIEVVKDEATPADFVNLEDEKTETSETTDKNSELQVEETDTAESGGKVSRDLSDQQTDRTTDLTTDSHWRSTEPLIEISSELMDKYSRQNIPGIGSRCAKEQVDRVIEFMQYWSEKQGGMVLPRNIRHWMCPPLDKEL